MIAFSESELMIMELIWSCNRPICAADVQNVYEEKHWKMQTINTMLKRLSNKGAIRFDKVKTGKTYTHYYTASISQDEYKQAQSKFFIENIHKGSLFSFVSSLVEQNAISSQDIERAKRWLAEWQKDEK